MSRLSKRLARKRSRRITVPGEQQALRRLSRLGKKLEQARASRKASTDDTKVAASAIEEIVPDGYTLREYDGPQPRRAELLPEWKGREPPEKP